MTSCALTGHMRFLHFPTLSLHASHAPQGDTKYTDLLLVTANRLGQRATCTRDVVDSDTYTALRCWGTTREFFFCSKICVEKRRTFEIFLRVYCTCFNRIHLSPSEAE
ncbi:hypothetical protein JTE90_016781 [Oedothorax gibbosus]|uniref:Secreted protein n=1 Tax=Oedothorax gibbosus TaxID=931172 RepID=A0AAV6VWX2_9ARAC|nr:hypothetical protein JTE90_016781 [Oedothorax gibbosus]